MTDQEKNHTDSGTVGAVEITAVRQQKNEVLAKWAGFEQRESDKQDYFKDKGWTYRVRWFNDGFERNNLPDFLHSLDVQAKWLWPKLKQRDIWMDIGLNDGRTSVLLTNMADRRRGQGTIFGDTPAEACADAILALIEGEK